MLADTWGGHMAVPVQVPPGGDDEDWSIDVSQQHAVLLDLQPLPGTHGALHLSANGYAGRLDAGLDLALLPDDHCSVAHDLAPESRVQTHSTVGDLHLSLEVDAKFQNSRYPALERRRRSASI